MSLLEALNVPQSEIDWFNKLFFIGVPLVDPSVSVQNLHYKNYPSAEHHKEELQKYLDKVST